MIKKLKITFKGSFQARFSTDPAPTAASPTDPDGKYSGETRGWTYAYQERPFDRIIRTIGPVQLRSALLDTWTPTNVQKVETDTGNGYIPVDQSDVFYGAIVSMGAAKFDTKAGGGGVTREALIDFNLHIGEPTFPLTLIAADPVGLPILDGVQGSDAAWERDYKARKPSLIQKAASMDPERKKVLAAMSDSYASFFQLRCPTKRFDLTSVQFGKSVSGVVTLLESPASSKYNWSMQVSFYRYDGDTLAGLCDGDVTAVLK